MSFIFRSRRPSPSTEEGGSGGKIVVARRRQPPASPYARPETERREVPLLPAPPGADQGRSPRWLFGVLSGAGKMISSVFRSEEGSSSGSEIDSGEFSDEESGYGDGQDGDSHLQKELPLLTHRGENSRVVSNISEEAQAIVPTSETKMSIQKLLMQETFSRDECDRLKKLIETRVVDSPFTEFTYQERDTSIMNAGKPLSQMIELPRSTPYSPANMGTYSSKSLQDIPDLHNTAVMEAKKWLDEKKLTSPSMPGGPVSFNTDMLLYGVEDKMNSPADLAKSYMREEGLYEASSSFPSFKVFKRQYLSNMPESTGDGRQLRLRTNDITIEPIVGKKDLPATLFQSNTEKIPSAVDESESKSAMNLDSTSLPAGEASNALDKLCEEEMHSENHDIEAYRLRGCTSVNLTDSITANKTNPASTTSRPEQTLKIVDPMDQDLAQFSPTRKADNVEDHLSTLTHPASPVEHDGSYLPEVKAASLEGIASRKQNNADGSSRPTNDPEDRVGRSVPIDTSMANNSVGQIFDSATKLQDAHSPMKSKINGSLIESSANNSATESNVDSDYGIGSKNGKQSTGTSGGPSEQPTENDTKTPIDIEAEAAPVSSRKSTRKRSAKQMVVAKSSPRTSMVTRAVAKAKPGRGRPKKAI